MAVIFYNVSTANNFDTTEKYRNYIQAPSVDITISGIEELETIDLT